MLFDLRLVSYGQELKACCKVSVSEEHAAEVWQHIMKAFQEAVEKTGGTIDGKTIVPEKEKL